jgi:ABC-type glycerol-3-phosphate transport system permease component
MVLFARKHAWSYIFTAPTLALFALFTLIPVVQAFVLSLQNATIEFNTDYGMLMTGAAVAAIPMMLVFFAFQRHFVEGIRIGGVKG